MLNQNAPGKSQKPYAVGNKDIGLNKFGATEPAFEFGNPQPLTTRPQTVKKIINSEKPMMQTTDRFNG